MTWSCCFSGGLCQSIQCIGQKLRMLCPSNGSLLGDEQIIRTSEVSWGLSEKIGDLRNLKTCLVFASIHLPNSITAQGRRLIFQAENFQWFYGAEETKIRGYDLPPNISETQLEKLEVSASGSGANQRWIEPYQCATQPWLNLVMAPTLTA